MLSKDEFGAYACKHQVSESALMYIAEVRSGEPSRMVGSRANGNTVSWVPSKKMGHTISTESRGPERAFQLECEWSEEVLEYYDQPSSLQITPRSKGSRKHDYTPDFLVLRRSGPCIVEVKDHQTAKTLMTKKPDDWIEAPDGGVEFVPAQEAFKRLELMHEVWIYQSSNQTRYRNLELLLRVSLPEVSVLPTHVEDTLRAKFHTTLSDLAAAVGWDPAMLLPFLKADLISSDINAFPIEEPDAFPVAASPELLELAVQEARSTRSRTPSSGTRVSQDVIPSAAAAERAMERARLAQLNTPTRDGRRARAALHRAREEGLSVVQALAPKHHRKGNRKPKRANKVIETLQRFLNEIYLKQPFGTEMRAYLAYVAFAEKHAPIHEPVSDRTFFKYRDKLNRKAVGYARGGRRASNAAAEPVDVSLRSPKPLSPWQVAGIDHYKADIEVVWYESGDARHTIRPWLTVMVDLFSTAIIAMTVSFRDPSRMAVAKALRDCIRRHGKLPSEILCDRGADFQSKYMASVLAHFEVTYSLLPPATPRAASQTERTFGYARTEWQSALPGYIKSTRDSRSRSSSHSPRAQAVLGVSSFLKSVEGFVTYFNQSLPPLRLEPRRERLATPGLGCHVYGIPLAMSDRFLVATAVDNRKKLKIDPSRGIKHCGQWYTGAVLRRLSDQGKRAALRLDPENPHVIYVKSSAAWEVAMSSHAMAFKDKSRLQQIEEYLSVRELTRQHQGLKKRSRVEYVKQQHEERPIETPESPSSPSGLDPQLQECHFDLIAEAFRELDWSNW